MSLKGNTVFSHEHTCLALLSRRALFHTIKIEVSKELYFLLMVLRFPQKNRGTKMGNIIENGFENLIHWVLSDFRKKLNKLHRMIRIVSSIRDLSQRMMAQL